jgi:DNA polymerase III subunit delta'
MSWDLIGHEWAVQLFRRHLGQARTRQAYLICGPDGVGKRTLATALASALSCQNPPRPGDSCGECRACRLIAGGVYPDLHVVEAERIGGVLKVEQIRGLQHQLALAPFEGRWRVAMLLRFHEANASAANALLKTLEEPASQAILILTARAPESLLPTIVSRCETVMLRPLPADEIAAGLRARGVEPEKAAMAAALAGGRPGRAMRLANDDDAFMRRRQIGDDLRTILATSVVERFRYVEKITRRGETAERRENGLEVLETWLALLRHAMHRSYGVSQASGNSDQDDMIAEIGDSLQPAQVRAAVEAAQRTLEGISQNANLRLALETLMLDLPSTAAAD